MFRSLMSIASYDLMLLYSTINLPAPIIIIAVLSHCSLEYIFCLELLL